MDIQEAVRLLQEAVNNSDSAHQKYKDAEDVVKKIHAELVTARRDQQISQLNLLQAARIGIRQDGVSVTMYRDSVLRVNELVRRRSKAQEVSDEALMADRNSETKIMDAESDVLKAALGDDLVAT